MSKEFDSCVSSGGRVRTIKPKPGKYIHICYPKGGGKSIAGEVKKDKEATKIGEKMGVKV